MENFQQQGTQAKKMIVTGKSSTDQIHEIIQASSPGKIKNQLGIHPDQPMLLCSVPQLGEHGILPWSEHWKEISFLFETLTKQKIAKVVVSLHPKSNPQDYRTQIEEHGIILSDHRIYELIPECDLFVATYSSTVVQAIGLGKPSIVIDFYGLNYNFYDQEPGIIVVKERDLFLPTIARILGNREYFDQLVDAQMKRAPEWILLDGHCTQRIMDKIYQMVEQ
jgi:hypothetical protein